MSDFPIIENEGALLVDSRLVAQDLGIEHDNFMQTIYTYQSQIEEEFGIFLFETEKIDRRGRPAKYALLTEDQSQVLMTFSRNTSQVIRCKIKLVKSFSKAKEFLKRLQQVSDAGSRVPYWYQRLRLALSDTEKPLQRGYFSLYGEMMEFFTQMEVHLNYIVPDISPTTGKHLIPDISIGLKLNDFLRSDDEVACIARFQFLGSSEPIDFRKPGHKKSGWFSGGSHHSEIMEYNHVYPKSSHAKSNIQLVNSYPNRYKSIVSYFLEQWWIPDRCLPYLIERDPDGIEYIKFAINNLPDSIRLNLSSTLLGVFIKSLPFSQDKTV